MVLQKFNKVVVGWSIKRWNWRRDICIITGDYRKRQRGATTRKGVRYKMKSNRVSFKKTMVCGHDYLRKQKEVSDKKIKLHMTGLDFAALHRAKSVGEPPSL